MKFPEWVKLGQNVIIEQNVILGVGRKEWGNLIIGDNCKIRSGSVIYRGTTMGRNSQTGHNAVIRENNNLGNKVVIGSFSELAPNNKIGSCTSIHSQCFLEEVTLGEYVFVAPGVKFLDDRLPVDPDTKNYLGAIVGDDTAIGGGSILLPRIKIGSRVLIGAGSVVTKDIPDGQVWAGNPARYLTDTKKFRWEGKTQEEYLPGNRRRYQT